MVSQITSLIQDADQTKHQSSASLAFVYGEFTGDRWIPRTRRPVTRKMFPFDDVIMGLWLSDERITDKEFSIEI